MQILRQCRFRVLAALLAGAFALGGCTRDDVADSPDDPAIAATDVDNRTAEEAGEETGAAVAGEPRAVVSETMPYAEVDDALVYGYFVAPSDMFEPLPAVIMIHEWWGLNDEIHARADRLAAQGYIVLAIDLFGGQTADSVVEARELMLGVVENPDAANQNIRSAYDFVSQIGAPTVATIGWRFGGTWSLNAAIILPDELDAAVIYYAQVTSDEDKLRPVNAPILGLFAENDISVSAASVEAFRDSLNRLRKEHELQFYAGVRQGFASERAANYDAASADQAWSTTLDFLKRHLAAGTGNGGGS